MRSSWRGAAFALGAAVAVAHSGCARQPRWPDLPPPPSEGVRASFGAVHLRAVDDPLEGRFVPPLAGTCSRVGFYSLQGAAVGFVVGGAILSEVFRGGRGAGGEAAILFL